MINTLKKMPVMLLCLLCIINLNVQATESTHSEDLLANQVNSSVAKHSATFLQDPIINSVSIGIYRKGKSYTAHFGELDKGQGNAANDTTIYEIASVTKTFTGTLVAQAVLDGRLSLKDDIRLYLKNSYPNLEFEGKPIKVQHLLTHTAGFPANNKNFEAVPSGNDDGLMWKRLYEAEKSYSKAEFFADLKVMKIAAEPGTQFLYSNVSTNMMAHILERVYKKSFSQLLQLYVFGPANMHETQLHLTEGQSIHLAQGYNEKGVSMPALPLADTLWGAEGALKSTMPDLIKYMKFQLDSENPTVNESHQRLHKLDEGYWVGYFWWVINIKDGVNVADGIKSYRHDGGAKGTRNVFIVYPEQELGISVITNVVGPEAFNDLTTLAKNLFEDLK